MPVPFFYKAKLLAALHINASKKCMFYKIFAHKNVIISCFSLVFVYNITIDQSNWKTLKYA